MLLFCCSLQECECKTDMLLFCCCSLQECERKANESKFRLRDLLHVPMQRVLKYHLLMRVCMEVPCADDGYAWKCSVVCADESMYGSEVCCVLMRVCMEVKCALC